MITGFKKQNRNIRPLLNHLMQHDHIFRLKAASDAGIVEIERFDHLIIPAAAVALLSRSIRMKLPVVRFDLYASKNKGCASAIRTSPMSFILKTVSVSTRARTVCVVCLSRYSFDGSSGAPSNQTTVASRVRAF